TRQYVKPNPTPEQRAPKRRRHNHMAPTNKEHQRAELHKTIWRIANDLRGSVDGWDFKSYVLGMLFYRFISENLTAYINHAEHDAGNADFDYAQLPDAQAEFGRAETVEEKGFYILPSELFDNVRTYAAHDTNLNEILAGVFKNIEGSALGTDAEDDLKGLFDDLDVNSSKLGNTVAKRNEKLRKLLDAIGALPLGNFEDNSIDLFGDAYEYLMQMYASSAGKSGGEYYTPREVSELLTRITVVGKKQVNKVYDPAPSIIRPVPSGSIPLESVKESAKGVFEEWSGSKISPDESGVELWSRSTIDSIEKKTFPSSDEDEVNRAALLIGEIIVRETGSEWSSYTSKDDSTGESVDFFGVTQGGDGGLSAVGNWARMANDGRLPGPLSDLVISSFPKR
ncbi:type I restriction-modification system subunit M, partial [Corynebacterium sp. AOP40-4SA-5]|uniref:type I restriction-modification system subunit M n=1 Tax=Corynebacterium sp. AOP40-4SA-5 TaxID=3457678 RepID=UPI004034E451